MNWDGERIRVLRLRLGFSPSDLARRLQCECTDIRSWEIGLVHPPDFQLHQLDLLSLQAEICADEVAANPLAEQILDKDKTGQVDLAHVKARFSGNN
jgi:transcriptional regulator with XRE-family HTH domain